MLQFPIRRGHGPCALAVCALLLFGAASSLAQDDYDRQRARAISLCDQNKFAEAVPILEKLNKTNPKDVLVIEKLALALVGVASAEADESARVKTLLRARSLALQARELGDDSNLIAALLERIPADGKAPEAKYSEHKDADEAMKQAEGAYAKGDFAAAIAGYQRALAADPKLYEAAVFMGDVYFQMKQVEKAGEAYSKAIAIDPNRETAYRYWADVLTKSQRLAEARMRLIDAIVAEPYNNAVYRGVGQWAQVAGVRPAHPQINVPEFKRENKDTKASVNIAVNVNETDGSSAWMWYSLSRVAWLDGKKFASAYPSEKNYRHSLAEELDALQAVLEAVTSQQKAGKIRGLHPQLATLMKLNQARLLEPYILLARADEGVAQDYVAYRSQHRDKIAQYLSNHVIPPAN